MIDYLTVRIYSHIANKMVRLPVNGLRKALLQAFINDFVVLF